MSEQKLKKKKKNARREYKSEFLIFSMRSRGSRSTEGVEIYVHILRLIVKATISLLRLSISFVRHTMRHEYKYSYIITIKYKFVYSLLSRMMCERTTLNE